MSSSALDRILVQYYGVKTPAEIAEELDIAPDEVIRRTNEMVGERDYLGEEAQFNLIMAQLRENVAFAMERLRSGEPSHRDVSGIMNAMTNAINKQMSALQLAQQRSSADVERVKAVYSRQLVEIVERAQKNLEERFSHLEPEFIEKELQEEILVIAAEVDAQ